MKRLAIYAHYSDSPQVAEYVLYCLEHIAALDFQICFVSNSEISAASTTALNKTCARVIVRENTGLDFSMWQRGLAEHDLTQFDELLLTNSSIIGPLQSLALLWRHPALVDCDFWGLTDNHELRRHLQSYFLVFRKPVIHDPRFAEFWRSVLPYRDKPQIIRNYEIGLTCWLEESGFTWRAVFAQDETWRQFRRQYGIPRSLIDYFCRRRLVSRNTTLYAPDILLQNGMPFIKTILLDNEYSPVNSRRAFAWLKNAQLPMPLQTVLARYPSW